MSVVLQTYQNWEIVLWDNNSQKRQDKIASLFNDIRIRCFRGNKTVTLGQARNLALKEARGEFIAFLDSDDLWVKDKLEKQIPLFINKEVGLVYSDVETFNSRGQTKIIGKNKVYQSGYCFGSLLKDYYLTLSSVVIRKEIINKNKIVFNKNYKMIEEMDVFLRIAFLSKIDFVPEVLAKWRVHSKSYTWRNYHLLADETEDMVKKFLLKYSGIKLKFPNEISALQVWIVRQKFLYFWMEGKNYNARKVILGSKVNLPLKIKSLYFLSFLNSKVFLPIVYKLFSSRIAP